MDLKAAVNDPNSCMNRAVEGEQIFSLLGRDPAAPLSIRAWAIRRMQLGLNTAEDTQILEAFAVAEAMDLHRESLRRRLRLQDVEPRVAQLEEHEARREASGLEPGAI